jgi:hypothetical protein
MKKILCLVISLLILTVSFSQINIKGKEYTGFGPFNLGDPVEQFGTNIKRIDSSVWKGKLSTTYIYTGQDSQSHGLANTRFNSCILAFDEYGKLYWIQLVRIKHKLDTTYTARKARKEAEHLVGYTNEITGSKAKKKLLSRYKSISTYIYQWKGEKTIIQMDITYRDKTILNYAFVVRWKKPEDDEKNAR